MERTQFTFYESFFKAISRIRNKSARAEAYDAICAYALYGTEPDLDNLSDAAAIAFELSKPNLDASKRRAISGAKGGSGKQSESKTEANGKQNGSKPQANTKQEQTASEKENEKESKKEKENECYIRARFTPPTLAQVSEYCKERCNGVDPQHFMDYYTANGWKVGKNPMKDWKAAVRTWENAEKGGAKSAGKPQTAQSSRFDGLNLYNVEG